MMHWLGGEDVESLCTHETSPFKHYDFVEHTKAHARMSACAHILLCFLIWLVFSMRVRKLSSDRLFSFHVHAMVISG